MTREQLIETMATAISQSKVLRTSSAEQATAALTAIEAAGFAVVNKSVSPTMACETCGHEDIGCPLHFDIDAIECSKAVRRCKAAINAGKV